MANWEFNELFNQVINPGWKVCLLYFSINNSIYLILLLSVAYYSFNKKDI